MDKLEPYFGQRSIAKQEEAFHSYESGNRFTLLRSANGMGKTAFLAALAVYHLLNTDRCNVIAIGPNLTHSLKNFWKEVKRVCPRVGIERKMILKDSLTLDNNRQLKVISPANVESAQGFHDPNTLILVDEATAVPGDVFTALVSNMSDATARLVCAYNPIRVSEFIQQMEKAGAHVIEFSALEHPNVVTGEEIVRGAVTRESIDTLLRVHSQKCTEHTINGLYIPWRDEYWMITPEIAARVLGRYALLNPNGLIDSQLILQAVCRNYEHRHLPVKGQKCFVGIDISRGRKDKSVAQVMHHGVLIDTIEFEHENLARLASEIFSRFQNDVVAIDDTGCGGGVVDRLIELGHENLFPVNFGGESRGIYNHSNIKPYNAKTEMVYLLERGFRNGEIRIPDDTQLQMELVTYETGMVRGNKFTTIKQKREQKRMLGCSPDKADALCLANYARELYALQNKTLFL